MFILQIYFHSSKTHLGNSFSRSQINVDRYDTKFCFNCTNERKNIMYYLLEIFLQKTGVENNQAVFSLQDFFFFYSDKVRKLNSQGFMDIFICKLFNLVYFVKYMMLFCLITMQRLIQEKARRCNMKTGKCKSSFKLSITADIAEVCYLTEYED